MTLRQLRQRNSRSAGCGPELRWSVKCFICAPQPLQTRMGISCGWVAESDIADGCQINRIAAEQFETLLKISRHQGSPFAVGGSRLTNSIRAGTSRSGDRTDCLRWCHQLTSKPRVCSWGSHRINQLGHSLVDVIASGAFKRPDIKARGAGCNPHQHRRCLARWTWRSGMGEHDCTPSSCGESTIELSVTGSCRVGSGDGTSIGLQGFRRCSVLLTFQNN